MFNGRNERRLCRKGLNTREEVFTMKKDERNKKIDEYLSNPKAKSDVLLEDMQKKTGESRDELIWEAVQLLWVRRDYN